jgi:hypothetical protein
MSSTNKTANYKLSQWLPGDALSHEDVNADNAKIDSAVKSVSDAASAIASGIASTPYCKIQAGTYTGTGTYGTNSKNTLTFAFTPKLVIVHEASKGLCGFGYNFSARWGTTAAAYTYASSDAYMAQTVTYSGNTISWYNEANSTFQCNSSGTVYSYIALG